MARSKVWTGTEWIYEDISYSGSGLYPQIVVSAQVGTEITVTDGTHTYTETSTEATTTFELVNYGTFTASATIDGETKTKTVEVDAVKIYRITLGLLPAEYQEVEYIKTTGTQYINTNLNLSDFNELRLDFLYESGNFVMGSNDYNYNNSGLTLGILNGTFSQLLNNNSWVSTNVAPDNNRHVWIVNNGYQSFDDSNYADENYGSSSYKFCLFRWNSTGTIAGSGTGKIYSAKFGNNGTLVRNFVPCYRISDNEPGLYDLKNNVFYTNQGSGIFDVGPDVN